ncbi:MAG: AbrB/MazE/SpoVT family DNA-binding domain-containing protein [Gammaproteobacteria bacterium]|nr:AbrB/MazE/SpoVT family DNA-binding domain-containing protein [Gammaproteobacteria bacterium]
MELVIKQWGDSAALCLPANILEAVNLKLDSIVEVIVQGEAIIIKPVKTTEDSLDALLEGITPENLHSEMNFGPAVGQELL